MRDHLRVKEPHHGGAGAHGCQFDVPSLKLTLGSTVRDDTADGNGDALHMSSADIPTLFHGDGDHLMQLGIADIAFGIHLMDRRQQFAEPRGGRLRIFSNRSSGLFNFPHQPLRHGRDDRLLRIEEAIDVRRAHPEHLGDISHGGLLVADFTKQLFRDHNDAAPHIGFDVIRNQSHLGVQSSVIRQQAERPVACRDGAVRDDPHPHPIRVHPGSCETIAHRGREDTTTSRTSPQTIHP